MDRTRAIEINRGTWDAVVRRHVDSDFYDVPAFLEGACTLLPLEREELGDVRGKSLCHLQCHFGLDTLSWSRLGARVTGVDFSSEAIRQARRIAEQAGLEGRFVEAPVDGSLPALLDTRHDIVYTGGGALCWLPDLNEWAGVVRDLLHPGGRLYLREFHPLAGIFDDECSPDQLRLRYPYFAAGGMIQFDEGLCYAVESGREAGATCEWPHALAEILQALIDAGLQLEMIREHAETGYRALPFLVEADGRWGCEQLPGGLPLMFSLIARRPLTERSRG